MAVVVQDGDGQRLDLYDADTCGLLQPDVAHSSGRITNVSIEAASLTYTEEVGDITQVRLMTYDRNRVPFTLTKYFEGVTDVRSLVGSDGTLAWVQSGETQPAATASRSGTPRRTARGTSSGCPASRTNPSPTGASTISPSRRMAPGSPSCRL